MNIILSNILIRPEPDDILEPNEELSVDLCFRSLRPFLPIKDKYAHGRWFESMTGYADKKYIVTGIEKEADAMMEYEIVNKKELIS